MNAKTIVAPCLAVLLICTGLARTEGAREFSAGVTADLYSEYVWRGQVPSEEGVFQPSVCSGCTASDLQ